MIISRVVNELKKDKHVDSLISIFTFCQENALMMDYRTMMDNS